MWNHLSDWLFCVQYTKHTSKNNCRELTICCSRRCGERAPDHSHVGGQHSTEAAGGEVQKWRPQADTLQRHIWCVLNRSGSDMQVSLCRCETNTVFLLFPCRCFLTDHNKRGRRSSVEQHFALTHPCPQSRRTIHVLWGHEEEGRKRREEGERTQHSWSEDLSIGCFSAWLTHKLFQAKSRSPC